MELAQEKLLGILRGCKDQRVDPTQLECVQEFLKEVHKSRAVSPKREQLIKVLLVCSVLLYCIGYYFDELQSKRCLLALPRSWRYVFRPPENCNFCEHVQQAARVRAITPQLFADKYASGETPIIVEDATQNWTALTKFNYNYFQDVYQNAKRKQKVLDCQFLPYKTGFKHLYEALSMPQERVELRSGTEPWYFGWSNCNPETAEEFRRHYGRPYFLPPTSENNAVDWFFIGTSGLGAHMHVDNVRLPSWQAQLAGSKRWLLVPPPECYFKCKSFDAVVNTGDMIVLDTNKWYHQTFVQPGQVSLTIGAEYD